MNKKCPDKIYLQACDKCYDEVIQHFEGVTWCFDNIGHEHEDDNAEDTVYVKLSRLKKAAKEIDEYFIPRLERGEIGFECQSGGMMALATLLIHFPGLKDTK